MKRIMIYALIASLAVGVFLWQRSRIKKLSDERDRYRANTETLLQDVRQYKTLDSLNAATVGVLELRLSEFEKYRAEDAALIRTLQTRNRDLQNVTTAQLETIRDLQGKFRDSVAYIPIPGGVDTVTLRCVDITDPWFELSGCEYPGWDFQGTFITRDSLLITATVQYKRFLGFLWKTRKVKNRKVDAVSRNPYTQIMGVEYIEIER